MPSGVRRYFSWPREVRKQVRLYVDHACALSPVQYRLEPGHLGALLGRLHGVAYDGPFGHVEFRCTIVDDRIRKSAESLTGCDFALVASIRQESDVQEKAILGQAKKGRIDQLTPAERHRLISQVRLMKRHSRAVTVLELPTEAGHPVTVVSGRSVLRQEEFRRATLGEYIVRRVLTCIQGDIDGGFVEDVSHSSLPQLRIVAIRNR